MDSFNYIGKIYQRHWNNSDKALIAYERARACARMLWPDLEQQPEIEWGHVEHRPFLRTFHGLAVVNLKLGNHEAAVEKLRFLLKVNPNDNQGCRKLLFSALLDLDRLDEAAAVAEKHSDGRGSNDAWFLWGIVLLDYHKFKRGLYDSRIPEESLCVALQSNNFVPDILLQNDPPTIEPSTISPGSIDEATSYVISTSGSWRRAEGALAWLRELRGLNGPKPPDDGTILFDLLTGGKIRVVVKEASSTRTLEVTSSLICMHGTALPDFELPQGMKVHDPSKIVCFNMDWEASMKFPTFSYNNVENVYFWSVLSTRKRWRKPRKDHSCNKCYEQATHRCAHCGYVWYCSKSCQRADWNERHKRQCKKYIKK